MKKFKYILMLGYTLFSAFNLYAKETIIFWHREEGASKQLLETLCQEFDQDQQTSVKLEHIVTDDMKTSLIKGALQKQLPHLALVPSDYLGLYAQMGLSEIPSTLKNSQIDKQTYATVSIRDKMYGVPILGGNHLMLFYNKKFVKTPVTTWEELLAQKDVLEKQKVKPVGWNYGEMYWFAGFIGAFGGWPVEQGKLTLDTPAVQNALIAYKSFVDQGLVPGDCNYDCNSKRFYQEEFAYALNGEWAYAEAQKALGANFGVSLIPSLGDKRVTPMFSTHALIFPGQSLQGHQRALLEKLITFMQSKNVQQRWYQKTGRIPVHQEVLTEFKKQADFNQQQMFEQLAVARAMPSDPEMAFAWEGMRKGFQRFMAGNASAQEATAFMQKAAVAQMKK
ncbi:extracellular solute-binding protein [Deltaproteobacteria bacterium TL4]